MFYPVDSLKRGGRFYLCWVADSWPLRFATITHRQLWSQDIRKICDDLLEVMTNESGRPLNRFSLRLSSQLMRGLARLYQRKVTVFLSDLCMINAHVLKHSNKKWNIQEEVEHIGRPRLELQQIPQIVIPEEPETEQRVEDMIQRSGNVVTNIQEITLKETTIPEFQLPPNDGFGEEHPDQPLQLLADRTLEMMLVPTDRSAAQHSGLDLPALDLTERSHDKSRLPHDLHMDVIPDQDITLFRRSTGEGLLPTADFEKDIPEIPEIPIPEMPVPEPEKQSELHEDIVPVVPPIVESNKEVGIEVSKEQEPIEIELEELEETEPQAKRRRVRNRLIVDKKIKISGDTIRARIENPAIELRCEDSSDDIIAIRVPFEVYLRRPSHAGGDARCNIAAALGCMFMRNLGVVPTQPRAEREMEEAVLQHPQLRPRSILERIEEVEEPATLPVQRAQMEPTDVNVTMEGVRVEPPRVSEVEQDIFDLPTQKIDTLSQAKRRAQYETVSSPKRRKAIGYISFRESLLASNLVVEAVKETTLVINQPIERQAKETEKSVTAMLQEAGLADIQPQQVMEVEPLRVNGSRRQPARQHGSESSETLLGSLDRTKVSLGDSEQTTDSKRFIRDQWGTEGTMIKILKCINEGTQPVNVWNLIKKGPVIPDFKNIIAARCFTSILKLKQHGFIYIVKSPGTLEIEDITLGPKFAFENAH